MPKAKLCGILMQRQNNLQIYQNLANRNVQIFCRIRGYILKIKRKMS